VAYGKHALMRAMESAGGDPTIDCVITQPEGSQLSP
jgi:hypothetical protein